MHKLLRHVTKNDPTQKRLLLEITFVYIDLLPYDIFDRTAFRNENYRAILDGPYRSTHYGCIELYLPLVV